MVNQQYIADKLKISRATVSRCFTNHPGINPKTRAKVFNLAAKLGYKHMEMRTAQSGGGGKAKRIAVLVCTEIEEFYRPDYESPGEELVAGVTEFGVLNKITVELHYVDPKAKSLDDQAYSEIKALRKRQVQGLILIYPFPKDIIDELLLKFPVVSLVEQFDSAALDCVDVDHYKGMATVLNCLKDLGHRRIGFYTKPYEVEASWSFRRFSGYVEKLARMGQPFRQKDTVGVYLARSFSLEQSYDYVRDCTKDGVTAWVCAADHQAYDLIEGLRKRGLRVPQDVSVTGFDGIHKPVGAPLLTTMMIPYHQIGLTGAKRLLDLINKRFESTHHILVESRFRKGETVGPAPA